MGHEHEHPCQEREREKQNMQGECQFRHKNVVKASKVHANILVTMDTTARREHFSVTVLGDVERESPDFQTNRLRELILSLDEFLMFAFEQVSCSCFFCDYREGAVIFSI